MVDQTWLTSESRKTGLKNCRVIRFRSGKKHEAGDPISAPNDCQRAPGLVSRTALGSIKFSVGIPEIRPR